MRDILSRPSLSVSLTSPQAVLDARLTAARRANELQGLALRLLATALSVYLLFGVVFGIAVVHGDSMFPNLKSGDVILFNRLDKNCRAGDIVLFHTQDERDLVKRVAACAGDMVDIDGSDVLRVNGVPQNNVLIFYPTQARADGVSFPLTVPDDHYFLLGDYRTVSRDSRAFGPVARSQLLGTVFWYSGLLS